MFLSPEIHVIVENLMSKVMAVGEPWCLGMGLVPYIEAPES